MITLALGMVAEHLERVEEQAGESMRGRLGGCDVAFVKRGRGWEISADIAELPVVIDIAARAAFTGDSTVALEDPVFDERYLVDAADPDLAATILDADLQRRVLALEPRRVTIAPGRIAVQKQYSWDYANEPDIHAALDLAVELAHRARRATSELDAELHRDLRTGGPYRDGADASLVRTAIATRDRNVAMARKRSRRRLDKRWFSRLAMVALLVLCWPVGLFVILRHRP